MGAASGSPPATRRRDLWICAGLGLLAAGVYLRALGAPFHFDDGVNILQNPFLRWNHFDLPGAWRAAFHGANRRPVANLSFALDYRLHGYSAPAFHAANLAVHAACSIAVFLLGRRLLQLHAALPGQLGPRFSPAGVSGVAALAAALFAAHPLQSQSVVYVVQRANGLATLFYLLALLLWVSARGETSPPARRARFALAGSSWLLALGSKEIAIALPAAVWLIEWFFLRDLESGFARWSARRLLPPLLLLAAGLFYLYFQGPDWGYHKREFGMGERALTQLRVLVFYLSLALDPRPGRLSIHQAFSVSHGLLDPPSTLLCGLLLATLLAAATLAARRLRWLSFGILWWFLHHALESSFLPLELAYEHRNYLPMAGLCFATAWALAAAAEQLALPKALAAAGAGLLIAALSAATALRVEVWRDNETLWRDAREKAPGEIRPLHNLGVALAGKRRFGQAMALYQEVLRRNPRHAEAHRNLGAALLQQGRAAEALPELEEAVRLAPDAPYAEAALGDALRLLGRPADAESHYRRALARFPDAQFFYGLAEVRAQQGDAAGALHWYEQALRLLPEFAPAEVARGVLLASLGRRSEAIAGFQRVLARWDDPETHSHLARALWEEGRHGEALAHAESAHRSAPQAVAGVRQLAWMLATCPVAALRDPARAAALVQERLATLPAPDAGLLDALAAARAAAGAHAEALRVADQALALARSGGDAALAQGLAARRELYAQGRSYTDAPAAAEPPDAEAGP